MQSEKFTAFLVVTTLSSVIPGPSVIFVMSQTAWRGPRAGIWAALGIQTGNSLYFVLSGCGLASAIAGSATLFAGLKLMGAAYLAWLGIEALRQSVRCSAETAAIDRGSMNGLRDGLLVSLGNHKSILYYVALLPQFLDANQPVFRQVMIMGVIANAIDLVVDLAYIRAGKGLSTLLGRHSIRCHFERGIGLMFLFLSVATYRLL